MRLTIFVISFLMYESFAWSQNYDRYFTSQSLRLDYIRAGASENMSLFLEQLRQEPYWGGSTVNLIDTFQYGEFMLEVYDSLSNILIYSRGYSTLSKEWQTTTESQHLSRSFYESVVMPFPKQTVRLTIAERNHKQTFNNIFELYVNPNSIFINKDAPPTCNTQKLIDNGDASINIDMVFIAEGYTLTQIDKFVADVDSFSNILFSWQPFEVYKDRFNVWLVFSESADSGTDIPGDNIWNRTALSSTFYTFGSERYLTPSNIKAVRDLAGVVPYDQIIILVNSDKYGGGGIYNFYNVFTSNHSASGFVFCHELGHGFAALADEYYTSDVAYNDYYDLTVEPYQANITTLINFDNKWRDLVESDTPIPTPNKTEYLNKIGAFEGGGYLEKNIYRPTHDCSMKSVIDNAFCPVCKRTIVRLIEFYTAP